MTISRSTAWRSACVVYRVAWTALTGFVYALGLVGAALALPIEALPGLFLAACLLGASCALSLWGAEALGPGRVAFAGILAGMLMLALLGLSAVAGFAGIVLLGALHGASPAMLGRLVRWRTAGDAAAPLDRVLAMASAERSADGAQRNGRGAPVAPRTAEELDVAALDGESARLDVPDHVDLRDLCLAWQSSYLALQKCGTTAARLQVVAERQACLDELERRDPEGLQAWLRDGARAASAPTRYLTR